VILKTEQAELSVNLSLPVPKSKLIQLSFSGAPNINKSYSEEIEAIEFNGSSLTTTFKSAVVFKPDKSDADFSAIFFVAFFEKEGGTM
jgi:effector-binding domain-containing protein